MKITNKKKLIKPADGIGNLGIDANMGKSNEPKNSACEFCVISG